MNLHSIALQHIYYVPFVALHASIYICIYIYIYTEIRVYIYTYYIYIYICHM